MPDEVNEARRWALITGSTSGIGRATALALSADGFSIIVHGRDAGRADAAVDDVRAAGGTAVSVLADCAVSMMFADSVATHCRRPVAMSPCW